MYPSSPASNAGRPSLRPQPPGRPASPKRGRPSRRGPSKGLWVALTVVVCAAAAAAVVFFWYLPGRDTDLPAAAVTSTTLVDVVDPQAADEAAKALVSAATAAMEAGYADLHTFDPTTMTPEVLAGIEPSITYVVWPYPDARACLAPTVKAVDRAVHYGGIEAAYAIGTVSASGTTFGINVNKLTGFTYYYVNGNELDWTAAADATSTTAPPASDVAATPGVFDDPALGISFQYPASWVEYRSEDVFGSTADHPYRLVVGDPLTQIVSMPRNFVVLDGARTPGQPAPTARLMMEAQIAGFSGQADWTEYEPLAEFQVNGVSACSWAVRNLSPTGPLVWRFVALSSGDAGFLFYFVSQEELLPVNRPLFDATLNSVQIAAPAP